LFIVKRQLCCGRTKAALPATELAVEAIEDAQAFEILDSRLQIGAAMGRE
jgi:hypothetical protein